MRVPSDQMTGSGWSFASVVMCAFCSFVRNECGAARKRAAPWLERIYSLGPATLCRGFCLCGRFAIRFRPVAVQALGRLGLLQLVELVERPRGQFAVV